jgi:branched-chain amino acid transport system permease protein
MIVRTPVFLLIWIAISAAVFAASVSLGNDYIFFAGYVVLQYVVLGTAWNILGGYCGLLRPRRLFDCGNLQTRHRT